MKILRYKIQMFLILTLTIPSEIMAISESRQSASLKYSDSTDRDTIVVGYFTQSEAISNAQVLKNESANKSDKKEDVNRKEHEFYEEVLLSMGFCSLTCLAMFLFFKHKRKVINMHVIYKSPIQSSTVVHSGSLFLQDDFEASLNRLNDLTSELENKKTLLSDMRILIESTNAEYSFDFKTKTSFQKILRNIHYANHADQEWDHFRSYFEKTSDIFLSNLRGKFPTLSHNDYKLCILYRMNTEHERIASIMEISTESVRVMRHRLKKKLNIPLNTPISEFLKQFDDGLENDGIDTMLRAS